MSFDIIRSVARTLGYETSAAALARIIQDEAQPSARRSAAIIALQNWGLYRQCTTA